MGGGVHIGMVVVVRVCVRECGVCVWHIRISQEEGEGGYRCEPTICVCVCVCVCVTLYARERTRARAIPQMAHNQGSEHPSGVRRS